MVTTVISRGQAQQLHDRERVAARRADRSGSRATGPAMPRPRCCPDWARVTPSRTSPGSIADAEQIARDDTGRCRENNSGGMQELLELRVEAVAETDGVGDRLHGFRPSRSGNAQSCCRARQRIALTDPPPSPAFASATVSDGSMLNATSVVVPAGRHAGPARAHRTDRRARCRTDSDSGNIPAPGSPACRRKIADSAALRPVSSRNTVSSGS